MLRRTHSDVDQYRGFDFDPVVGLYLPGRGIAIDKEQLVARMAPRHWYRADTYTLSGSNLATLPNRNTTVGGHLAVAAGTIAAPVADGALAGAQSASISSTAALQANHTPAEFAYLSAGGGAETWCVLVPTNLATTRSVWATKALASGAEIGAALFTSSPNTVGSRVGNGVANIVSASVAGVVVNTGTYITQVYKENDPNEALVSVKDVYTATAATTGAPTSADPQSTLRVGATIGGATAGEMRFAEFLSFNRVLTPYERQLVREYIEARYGIAAPVWSAEDRSILALNPFSWIRADNFTSSGGKVTAFLDKVLPGHSMTQATVPNQVADPTADSAMNGQLAATFTGAQQYRSSLAAAAWSMFGLLNKEYCVLFVNKPTTAGTSEHWLCTRPAAGGAGFNLLRLNTNVMWHLNQKTSVGLVNSQGVTARVANVPLLTLLHASGPANSTTLRVNKVVENTSALVTAPDGTAQADTLTLGARFSLNSPASGTWADAIVLDRVPTAAEIATLENYAARYGL